MCKRSALCPDRPSERFEDYVNGMLSDTAAAALEDHIDECGSCGSEWDSWWKFVHLPKPLWELGVAARSKSSDSANADKTPAREAPVPTPETREDQHADTSAPEVVKARRIMV